MVDWILMNVGTPDSPPNPCILDTSALKHIARVDMAGKTLLELAQETLDIMIPDEVRTEVIQRYARDPHTWEKAHFALKTLTQKIKQTDPNSVQFLEDWIRRHHDDLPIARTVHPGEQHCAALAFKKSVDERAALILTVLDDSSARVALNAFFCRQAVGIAASTADLILLLLGRSRRVTKDQAIRAMNEFYSGYQDSLNCPLKPGYLNDVTACWKERTR